MVGKIDGAKAEAEPMMVARKRRPSIEEAATRRYLEEEGYPDDRILSAHDGIRRLVAALLDNIDQRDLGSLRGKLEKILAALDAPFIYERGL